MAYLFTSIKGFKYSFCFAFPYSSPAYLRFFSWHLALPFFFYWYILRGHLLGWFQRQFLSCISSLELLFPLKKTLLLLFLSDKAIISVLFASIWLCCSLGFAPGISCNHKLNNDFIIHHNIIRFKKIFCLSLIICCHCIPMFGTRQNNKDLL